MRDDVLEYAHRALGEGGILAVDETGFYQVKPGDMVQEVPSEAWVRLSAGAGTRGPRLYDWARMRLNRYLGLSRWLMFRKSLADSKVAFYVAHARRNASLESRVRAAGNWWAVVEDFESAKNEVGTLGLPRRRNPMRAFLARRSLH